MYLSKQDYLDNIEIKTKHKLLPTIWNIVIDDFLVLKNQEPWKYTDHMNDDWESKIDWDNDGCLSEDSSSDEEEEETVKPVEQEDLPPIQEPLTITEEIKHNSTNNIF